MTPIYDENCVDFINTVECSICRPGTYWNGTNCISCGDMKSCYLCETLDTSKCKLCKSGYIMDEKGECNKIFT